MKLIVQRQYKVDNTVPSSGKMVNFFESLDGAKLSASGGKPQQFENNMKTWHSFIYLL